MIDLKLGVWNCLICNRPIPDSTFPSYCDTCTAYIADNGKTPDFSFMYHTFEEE